MPYPKAPRLGVCQSKSFLVLGSPSDPDSTARDLFTGSASSVEQTVTGAAGWDFVRVEDQRLQMSREAEAGLGVNHSG